MLKKTKIGKVKKTLKKVPRVPGVYFFYDSKDRINYIGKGKDLRARLSSYFIKNLGDKTREMLEASTDISFIKVTSELEALLLEARLIKEKTPKYNVQLKDDKHPLYIRVTNEKWPRLITARKADLNNEDRATYGPFPSAQIVRSVLKLLRRIFPFSTHKIGKRACFYSQLGLCDPCPNTVEKGANKKTQLRKKYLTNIRLLNEVLSGKVLKVKRSLKRTMQDYSKNQLYEEASIIRDKLRQLAYLTQPVNPLDSYLENPNFFEDVRQQELADLRKILSAFIKVPKKLRRIECFDVAHLSGKSATASMVTFINGVKEKSLYRHFRLRHKKTKSDFDSMKEVLSRRAKHLLDWGQPSLIIVDGGRAQVNAFREEFEKNKIPVVGISKRQEKLVIPFKGGFKEIRLKGPSKNLVERLRDEAHRFAQRYHHNLLKKQLLRSQTSEGQTIQKA